MLKYTPNLIDSTAHVLHNKMAEIELRNIIGSNVPFGVLITILLPNKLCLYSKAIGRCINSNEDVCKYMYI